ncbi:MAG: hypothetical protein EPN30_06320 [Actinomycetota bacterium]|nr:MAG: hypothetical protein EPN30_06320 [Actinomycetota bacterium]
MRELVALDMPASNLLVDIIRAIWDDGNGFVPIDQRLSFKAKQVLVKSLRPSQIIDSTGTSTKIQGAMPLENEQCLAMATSGTTGQPKMVMFTMAQIMASASATSSHIGVTFSDKWLCCLPIAHIGGLSVILRALLIGNPVEIHNGFNADDVKAAAKDGATLVSLVPTAMARLDPYIFRKIILGGSKPPANIPSNTMVTYGLTETGSGVVYDGMPLTGVEFKVASSQEIMLKGPMIATRYRSGAAIQDDLGWFHTGDAGRISHGKLDVDGRIDEIINTGGENISPALVERVLEMHPKVHQVAVIGLPDPKWGEAVTAVVIPNPNHEAPRLEELRDFVKSELPPHYAPTRLQLVSRMPTTNLGKIQKNVLKKQLAE